MKSGPTSLSLCFFFFPHQWPCTYTHRGTILRGEEGLSCVGERQFGKHFKRQFGLGLLRIEKLPQVEDGGSQSPSGPRETS